MPDPIALKYRAFISYAHADGRWAKWLHGRLEAFKIDKDLVGRDTPMGPVPRTLRPIFRDRDEFTAGHTLTEQTLAALDGSAALIVLCSPTSARSHYVNEEIRLFRERHPDRPVIPLILNGTPGDEQDECFPHALKFTIGPQGQITETPEEVLAADVREGADGKPLSLARVVAGLLALSTDDIVRRAERARRRSARVRNGVIAGLALLTVVASGSAVYAWQQLKTSYVFCTATLKRATKIVNTAVAQAEKYNVPRTATLEMTQMAEGLLDNMPCLGFQTKVWMLIEFARNYKILGDTKKWEREEEAHSILEGLLWRDSARWHNWQVDHGSALNPLKACVCPEKHYTGSRLELCEHCAPIRRILPHERRYEPALAIAERLPEVVVPGKLPDALTQYQDALAIAERLADYDPENAEWQRDLALSHAMLASVYRAAGDTSKASEHLAAGRAIIAKLVAQYPAWAQWKQDLAWFDGQIAALEN